MTLRLWTGALAAFAMTACGDAPDDQANVEAPPAQEPAEHVPQSAEASVLTLRAVGLQFEGPSRAPAGWTTIRFENVSGMAHFAVIERLPEGVTIEDQVREVVPPFQQGMDLLTAGDAEAAGAAFGQLPEWFGDVVFLGGPGLLSGGGTSEATVHLEPGRYTIECYVKTNGVFHSYNPVPGERGMVHELIVVAATGETEEPEANATLIISSDGFELTGGELRTGANTIRAEFAGQTVYTNFVGHDAHIVRLSDETDLEELLSWMDWTSAGGLETPAPAVFVGGINEMPAGTHGYFTVDLEPGDYAFIAEIPNPRVSGFYLPFSVEE